VRARKPDEADPKLGNETEKIGSAMQDLDWLAGGDHNHEGPGTENPLHAQGGGPAPDFEDSTTDRASARVFFAMYEASQRVPRG
jgi:hypothetical protein